MTVTTEDWVSTPTDIGNIYHFKKEIMEQQLSDILKNYEDLKKQVHDFITNTEHFIFYWLEEGEVKSFIKKNPDNYEELIKLSVVSISDTSAWVIIHLGKKNMQTRCDFGPFKEYTLYQWDKFNGKLKQHRIRQIQNEIEFHKQRIAENEELLKGLKGENKNEGD